MMSLCFFAVLALVPEPFFLQDNVYRQLPLYCFLEKEAASVPQREDPETNEALIASNAEYLSEQVKRENSGVSEEENRDTEKEDNQSGTADSSGTADFSSTSDSQAPVEEAEEHEEKNQEISDLDSGSEPVLVSDSEPAEPDIQSASAEIEPHPVVDLSEEMLADYDYFLGQFFIVDPNTATNPEQLNAAQFLAEDLTMERDASKPQILIYHSHSQETFADSREGEPEDTIVGVGSYLTQLLIEDYGYNVIHVTETFDIIDGEIDRSRAYDFSREYVEKVLVENPSIEVVIDLHRDGVPEDRHLVTQINGKDTAQIMFYNGLSYTVNNGPVDYLPNPYIQDNLAFSFQLEYQAALYYPELYRGIYLAGLRYNLHMRPKALLLEAGAQTNTIQEVKNAMEPFADILNRVLEGTD